MIDLIPNINYSFNRILISYRIGQNKTYLIKNLKEFIYNYRYHNVYTYGSQLTTDYNRKSFSSEALKQIDLFGIIANLLMILKDIVLLILTNIILMNFLKHISQILTSICFLPLLI